MSRESVEVVRAAYEAWLRGDIDASLELMSPDIVIKQPPEQADARTYVGREGLLQAVADWGGQWDDWRLELQQVIDADPDVVVTLDQRARGKASGVEVGTELACVHSVVNGKITRFEMFFSEEEALEAARLRS